MKPIDYILFVCLAIGAAVFAVFVTPAKSDPQPAPAQYIGTLSGTDVRVYYDNTLRGACYYTVAPGKFGDTSAVACY